MYAVCPFGERRHDLRMAYHTAHIMAAQSMGEVKDEQFNATIDHLSSYLKCDSGASDEQDIFNPEALKRMKENQCQDSETT